MEQEKRIKKGGKRKKIKKKQKQRMIEYPDTRLHGEESRKTNINQESHNICENKHSEQDRNEAN